MNLAHDLGGRDGFGPVVVEPSWESWAVALEDLLLATDALARDEVATLPALV